MSGAADQRRDRRNQLTRVDRLGGVNLVAGEQGAAAIAILSRRESYLTDRSKLTGHLS
jgi:hypothetical protein